jgi:hypothetical protein
MHRHHNSEFRTEDAGHTSKLIHQRLLCAAGVRVSVALRQHFNRTTGDHHASTAAVPTVFTSCVRLTAIPSIW